MAKGRKRKAVPAPKDFVPRKPSLREDVGYHADTMARSILGEHPMLKSLKPRIARAVMNVAKGVKGMSMKKATVARV
jgi:hypothetical protein